MRKILSFIALFSLLFAAGCQSAAPVVEEEPEASHTVITSFYPLYFFTSEVLGDTEGVELTNLIPSGGEPHTFEPSPSQLGQMESADLLIVQGAGLEPWFEGLDVGVASLEVNAHLDLMAAEEGHDDRDDHGHDDEDPHTWLDPVLAAETVEHIREALVVMDEANAAAYEANADELVARLGALDAAFAEGLASCSLDAFITSHDAFGYLAKRYGLHVHAVAGISPFDEPSAHQLTELIEVAEHEGVEHIFFEVLANSEAAEVLADEAGLDTLVLNPIAGLSSDQSAEDYFSLMEANLANLRTGLACE